MWFVPLKHPMASDSSKNSYAQILKSTALIGGSSAITILLGIVRTKFAAVFLGPFGIGLMGTYVTITGAILVFAGMGLGSSGIRQIAEAAASGDDVRIARSVLTVRRMAFVLGCLGVLLLVVLAAPISMETFGTRGETTALIALSVTVLLGAISAGQCALIQGLRRIGDLAKLSVLGAVLGTLISIPMIYLWGQKSIVPILLTISATGTLMSWHFARKITTVPVQMTWAETWKESIPLFRLGVVFMGSALMTALVAYITRLMIIRGMSLDAAGLYQSSWNLSNVYVGFILAAMGADFYPRLTALAKDHPAVNQLVNEQTEVALLMALPGLVATLAVAPWVIQLFYSAEFVAAADVLRWQALGLVLRVVSWPLGFILIAKGEGSWFFWTELLTNFVYVGIFWLGITFYGLPGSGMAFLGLYVFYLTLIYFVAGHLTAFRWSVANIRLILLTVFVSSFVFIGTMRIPTMWCAALGGVITLLLGGYSLKMLTRLLQRNPLASVIFKVKQIFGRVSTRPLNKPQVDAE